jgi:chromosome segregation ATPase
LVLTISALNKLCKSLALSIERLKEENDKLSDNVLELSCSVDTLRIEVENSLIIEKELRTTLGRLQESAVELKKNLSENQQSYDLTIKKIELYKRDQLYHEQILKNQIEELRKREAEYKGELEKNKNLTRALQQTIQKLSNVATDNAKQRKLFQENKFLIAGDENLSEFVKAEKKLGSITVQLESSLMRHKMLLEQQGKLLQHLVRVDGLIDNPEERDEKVSNTDALCTLGLLAVMPKSKSNSSDESNIPPII